MIPTLKILKPCIVTTNPDSGNALGSTTSLFRWAYPDSGCTRQEVCNPAVLILLLTALLLTAKAQAVLHQADQTQAVQVQAAHDQAGLIPCHIDQNLTALDQAASNPVRTDPLLATRVKSALSSPPRHKLSSPNQSRCTLPWTRIPHSLAILTRSHLPWGRLA